MQLFNIGVHIPITSKLIHVKVFGCNLLELWITECRKYSICIKKHGNLWFNFIIENNSSQHMLSISTRTRGFLTSLLNTGSTTHSCKKVTISAVILLELDFYLLTYFCSADTIWHYPCNQPVQNSIWVFYYKIV